jgi:hypothetical protein
MEIRPIIQSQYLAGLEMLSQAVEKCPESLWDALNDKNKFWHIAYHALFYTHLYLHPSEKEFKPWEKHRPDYESMGPLPWAPDQVPKIGEPYSQNEILEFISICQTKLNELVPSLELQESSGFSWLPFNKLELQLYNIRHLMLHTGELCERLGTQAGVNVGWVGAVKLDH